MKRQLEKAEAELKQLKEEKKQKERQQQEQHERQQQEQEEEEGQLQEQQREEQQQNFDRRLDDICRDIEEVKLFLAEKRHADTDKKLDEIRAELAKQPAPSSAVQPTSAAEPVQQVLTLQVAGPSVAQPVLLSPRILLNLPEFNYEAIGGRRVRCLACGDERLYNATRLAKHVCPPE